MIFEANLIIAIKNKEVLHNDLRKSSPDFSNGKQRLTNWLIERALCLN